jgi:cytochrome c peroxidase
VAALEIGDSLVVTLARSARSVVGWLCLSGLGLTAFRVGVAGPSAARPARPPGAAEAEPVLPLPLHLDLDQSKVDLGRRLFLDPRLSHDNTIFCGSCHRLELGGTDRRIRSLGIAGAEGDVNAPTVFNSGLNFRQFWDGRAATLEDQIDGPVNNPKEMGSSWPEVIGKLGQDREYVRAFRALYPDGLQSATIKDAIATFERSLITPNSPFDRFLRGDGQALTEQQLAGYRLFKAYGCVACHQGVNIGGNMFQKFGVARDYFADRGHVTTSDLGRFNVTGLERDRYRFKVPSLRNVALTAPYFHDGSAATLEQAVNIMARYQLGRTLPPHDRDLIVGFLRTLTGEYGGEVLR